MGEFSSIIFIIVVWILSFIEPSGWSIQLDLPNKVSIAILLYSAILFITKPASQRLPFSSPFIYGVVLFLLIIPYIKTNTFQGASYLTSFLIVYIFSQAKITRRVIAITGISIAVLGLIILNIYVNGEILSGWNDNAISMVGLFSFIYFSIYLFTCKGKKRFWFWSLITIIYVHFLFKTDCRSGMLFLILTIICILFSKGPKKILQNSRYRLVILNTPLILAFIVILISLMPFFDLLNEWSIEKFHKFIFNGRDELWSLSLVNAAKDYFLGSGKFLINYHNSGIAALCVFGVIGYFFWIKLFSKLLQFLNNYTRDAIVYSCMFAFCMIYLQQSVDLGFISETPNYLPYLILGIGLGRSRLLIRQNKQS